LNAMRTMRLIKSGMLFDAVHHPLPAIRRAALWELDLDEVLATSFRSKAGAFLEAGPVKDILDEMALPGNLVYTAAGDVGFRPGLWDDFVRLSEERIGIPMGQEVKDEMSKLFVREQTQSSAEAAKAAGIRAEGLSGAAGVIKNYNLQDVKATQHLANNNLYWVKTGGHRNIEPGLAKVVKEGLDKGLGRKTIAENLRSALGHAYQVEESRWAVVASAAMNRARVFSRMREMARLDIEIVRFFNPMDKRTSEVCQSLHGNEFKTVKLMEIVTNVENSTTPEQAMDAQPWLSVTVDPETKEQTWFESTSEGRHEVELDELKASGRVVPPLHGNCRSELIGVFKEESEEERRSWTETRTSEAKVTVTKNAASAASILAQQGKKVPAVAEQYRVDELQGIAGVSEYGERFLNQSYTWNSTDDAFSMTTNWSKKDTGWLAARWMVAATSDTIAVVNEAMVKMPCSTIERIGKALEKVAGKAGVKARMVLPLGSNTGRTAEALLDWHLEAQTAGEFGAWLDKRKMRDLFKRLGVSFNTNATMRELLTVRVNGVAPVQQFLHENADATFEWLP